MFRRIARYKTISSPTTGTTTRVRMISYHRKPMSMCGAKPSAASLPLAKVANSSHSTLIKSPYAKIAFDSKSIAKVSSGSKHVVVYGWSDCHFANLKSAINDKAFHDPRYSIRAAYDYSDCAVHSIKIEGRELTNLNNSNHRDFFRNGLSNIVFENFKRSKEKKSFIPVIFCMDIDDKHFPFSVENLLSRNPMLNSLITHQELRRACYLSTDPNPDVRKAAEQTFKFVKLKNTGENTFKLEETTAPYRLSNYNMFLSARNSTSIFKSDSAQNPWRQEMYENIREYKKCQP
jgi:hypothetical protein